MEDGRRSLDTLFQCSAWVLRVATCTRGVFLPLPERTAALLAHAEIHPSTTHIAHITNLPGPQVAKSEIRTWVWRAGLEGGSGGGAKLVF